MKNRRGTIPVRNLAYLRVNDSFVGQITKYNYHFLWTRESFIDQK